MVTNYSSELMAANNLFKSTEEKDIEGEVRDFDNSINMSKMVDRWLFAVEDFCNGEIVVVNNGAS
jgi:hypothetical protein